MSDDYPIQVPLSREYTLHNRPFSAIAMRAPRWPDYIQIGDVEQWMSNGDIRWLATVNDAVAAYANRLCEDSAQLLVLDLVDAIEVEEQIKDFFMKARALRATRTISSGGSDGNRQTSSE